MATRELSVASLLLYDTILLVTLIPAPVSPYGTMCIVIISTHMVQDSMHLRIPIISCAPTHKIELLCHTRHKGT
jgi:hypothetical protein